MKRILVFILLWLTFPAQSQDASNDLVNELLDKVNRLQSELANLRNQNERLQYELEQFKRSTEEELEALRAMQSRAATATVADSLPDREDETVSEDVTERKEASAKPQKPAGSADDIAAIVGDRQGNLPVAEREYAMYRSAMQSLQDADYARLRKELSRLLKSYPNGKYAASAKYWIAETYYIANQYDRAEHYYKRVIEEHERHSKREDSLLKIAYIRESREQWDGARVILQQLADSAKNEKIRTLAETRLQQLKQRGH